MKQRKRIAAFALAAVMVFSTLPMNALAVENPNQNTSGLCEHHTAHDEQCGYAPAGAETPCNHQHGDGCYATETNCTHQHTSDCFPAEGVSDNAAAPAEPSEAEPTNCTHVCSEDSGCTTKKLDCKHTHDETCGYTPATEEKPCTYVCEICNTPSGDDAGQTPEDGQEQCACIPLCTEGNINPDCPVCSAENADLSACKGKVNAVSDPEPNPVEPDPEPAECICTTRCTVYAIDKQCPVCGAEDADLTACMGKPLQLEVVYSELTGTKVVISVEGVPENATVLYSIWNISKPESDYIEPNENNVYTDLIPGCLYGVAVTVGSMGTVRSQFITAPAADAVTINYEEETIAFDGGLLEVNSNKEFSNTPLSNNGKITAHIGQKIYMRCSSTIGPNAKIRGIAEIDIPVRPASPKNLRGANVSAADQQDGKILNLTPNADYQISTDETNWVDRTTDADGVISNLAVGTYKVRTKAAEDSFASVSAEVTIGVANQQDSALTLTIEGSMILEGGPYVTAYDSTITLKAKVEQTNTRALSAGDYNTVTFYVGTGDSKRTLGTAKVDNNEASLTNVKITAENGWGIDENTITAEFSGHSDLKPTTGTATLTVTKAQQDAPTSAPTVSQIIGSSVTLDTVADGIGKAQYARVESSDNSTVPDEDAWQKSPTFQNLKNSTAYTFYTRYYKTDFYQASPASPGLTVITAPHTSAVSVNYKAETISILNPNVEVSPNSDFSRLFKTGDRITSLIALRLYMRAKVEDTTQAPIRGVTTVSIPPRPDHADSITAVNASAEGANDGKITGVSSDMEYREENIPTWTDCPGDTVENLAPGTYYVRTKATEDSFASVSAEVTIGVAADSALTLTIENARQPTQDGLYAIAYLSQITLKAEIKQADIRSLSAGDYNTVTFYVGEGDSKAELGTVGVVDGKASLPITLSGDTWNKGFKVSSNNTITAEFSGHSHLKPATGTVTLRVTRASPSTKPSAPAVSQASPITDTSVTLETVTGGVAGAEYSCKVSADELALYSWQDSPTFSGLTPGTAYTFNVRYKENSFYISSAPSDDLTVVTAPAADAVTINYINENITFDMDKVEVNPSKEFTGIDITNEGDIRAHMGSSVYVRAYSSDADAPIRGVTELQIPYRPASPSPKSISASAENQQDGKIINLTPNADYQISTDSNTDNKQWTDRTTDANGVISNLAAGTYWVRTKATPTQFAGASDSVTIGVGNVITIELPTFDSVYAGYTQPDPKRITIQNSSDQDVALTGLYRTAGETFIVQSVVSRDYTVPAGGSNTNFTVQPGENLGVGDHTATITAEYGNGQTATATVRFTVLPKPGIIYVSNDNTYYQGSRKDLTFVSNQPTERMVLSRTTVDGAIVPQKYLKQEDGDNAAVTLTNSFLRTLRHGSHTLTLYFSDGQSASATFSVRYSSAYDPTNPKTSDGIFLPLTILPLSAAALTLLLQKQKKSRRK